MLASDLPVIRSLLAEWGFGSVAPHDEPARIAERLGALLAPAANERFRAAARHASQHVTWSRERRVLAAVYESAAA